MAKIIMLLLCIVLVCLNVFSHICHGQNLTKLTDVCDEDSNCLLPNCFCPNNTKGPTNVSVEERPRIVVLAFNDAVNERNFNYYMTLLNSNWKNANGCPISLTLFVPDIWTNYTQLGLLWKAGAEVAAFGKSGYGQTAEFYKKITKKSLQDEIGGQKENFVKKGKIPAEYIRGFRMPHLYAGGDDMFDVLKSFGFDYDSSLIVNRSSSLDSLPSWPATLDYRWPFECKIGRCPLSSHPSFWEIPLQLLFDVNKTHQCQYIDSCAAPTTEEEAFQLMWRNYLPFYQTRTPFILNLRASWLNADFQRIAMRRLLLTFVESEVYLVSMSQLVDWMKSPASQADVANNFPPWSCTNGVYDRRLLASSSVSSNGHGSFVQVSSPNNRKIYFCSVAITMLFLLNSFMF